MSQKNDVFAKINDLLEGTGYPSEIRDITDLEDFLNEVDNQQYEEYDEIERLYDELMDNDTDYDED